MGILFYNLLLLYFILVGEAKLSIVKNMRTTRIFKKRKRDLSVTRISYFSASTAVQLHVFKKSPGQIIIIIILKVYSHTTKLHYNFVTTAFSKKKMQTNENAHKVVHFLSQT